MQFKLKADWLTALRSDRFSQYHGAIGIGSRLCCIGVCGAVAGLSQEHGWFTSDVCEQVGIDDAQRNSLVKLNDFERKTFIEIADWVEANISVEA